MTDTPVPTTLPMSTYSVVPYQDLNGILRCLYLDADLKCVPANELDCAAQEGKVDFICLKPLGTSVPSNIPATHAVMQSVTLLAAVVKTIKDDDCLPCTYLADDQQRLVLPVMPHTRRATILIFSVSNADGVSGLIATADPEIKNSTDGSSS